MTLNCSICEYLLMHSLDDARVQERKGLPDRLVGFKDGGRPAAERGDEFIQHGFPEWIAAVLVGNDVTIFLHVFVGAEDGGWDDRCVMLVLPRAIDDVSELSNDEIRDTGDAEMDGQSVGFSKEGASFWEGLFDARHSSRGISDGGQQVAVDVELIRYHPAIDMVEGVGLMIVDNDYVFVR